MISDNELKKGVIYWVEVIDPELKGLFGKQSKMLFTSVQFRSLKDSKVTLYLSQVNVLKEVSKNDESSGFPF